MGALVGALAGAFVGLLALGLALLSGGLAFLALLLMLLAAIFGDGGGEGWGEALVGALVGGAVSALLLLLVRWVGSFIPFFIPLIDAILIGARSSIPLLKEPDWFFMVRGAALLGAIAGGIGGLILGGGMGVSIGRMASVGFLLAGIAVLAVVFTFRIGSGLGPHVRSLPLAQEGMAPSSPTPTPMPRTEISRGSQTVEGLPLRAGCVPKDRPLRRSPEGPIIGSLPRGTPVWVLHPEGSGFRIRTPEGEEGYLAGEVRMPPFTDLPVACVRSTRRLNLRAGPGTRYEIRARLEPGTPIGVLEPPRAGWMKVRTSDGLEGFVSVEWISPFALGPGDKKMTWR